MEKYPFFEVDNIYGNPYPMRTNFMTLLSYLVADSSLTLPASKSTWVPQADRMVIGNEERGAIGGTFWSITSHLSSASSGLANIDLALEMMDEKSREKFKGKIMWIENKLKKEREFHRAISANYKDKTMQNMVEIRYRMHLYWYEQKIQQCEIHLAHTKEVWITGNNRIRLSHLLYLIGIKSE